MNHLNGMTRENYKDGLCAYCTVPGTTSNQRAQINKFQHFCKHYNIKCVNPSMDTILTYIEYLAQSFKSPSSVKNYLSGI